MRIIVVVIFFVFPFSGCVNKKSYIDSHYGIKKKEA